MMSSLLPSLEGTRLSGLAVRFPADLPSHPSVLLVGFTHAARLDVAAWKQALIERGIPFLSLPTAATDQAASDMDQVARAMRAHLPRDLWHHVIQIHRGGEALRERYGWKPDAFAKVIWVEPGGEVRGHHDEGPFTSTAVNSVVRAGASGG